MLSILQHCRLNYAAAGFMILKHGIEFVLGYAIYVHTIFLLLFVAKSTLKPRRQPNKTTQSCPLDQEVYLIEFPKSCPLCLQGHSKHINERKFGPKGPDFKN